MCTLKIYSPTSRPRQTSSPKSHHSVMAMASLQQQKIVRGAFKAVLMAAMQDIIGSPHNQRKRKRLYPQRARSHIWSHTVSHCSLSLFGSESLPPFWSLDLVPRTPKTPPTRMPATNEARAIRTIVTCASVEAAALTISLSERVLTECLEVNNGGQFRVVVIEPFKQAVD